MTNKDIQQLQTIVRTEIGNALEDVVLPELVTLKTDVAHMRGQLNTRYPDKAYLDDKLNELRGDILAARKQDTEETICNKVLSSFKFIDP